MSGFRDDEHGEQRLSVRIGEAARAETVLLVLAGELDREETGRFVSAVSGVVGDCPGQAIEIDARDLTFLDSSGLSALVHCRQQLADSGSRLTISDISPIGYQVLEMTDLLTMFGQPRGVMSSTPT